MDVTSAERFATRPAWAVALGRRFVFDPPDLERPVRGSGKKGFWPDAVRTRHRRWRHLGVEMVFVDEVSAGMSERELRWWRRVVVSPKSLVPKNVFSWSWFGCTSHSTSHSRSTSHSISCRCSTDVVSVRVRQVPSDISASLVYFLSLHLLPVHVARL